MQPDYLAFNSMSFSNGANRDTELQVIVYQYWNADEVVAEIEAIFGRFCSIFFPPICFSQIGNWWISSFVK